MSLNTQSQLYEAVLQVRVSFANKNLMIDNLNNSKGMIIVLCIMNDNVCIVVIFYSCSLMGENCGQCLSIESKFQCGYCKDMCIPTTLNSCSSMLTGVENVNQCEPPVITNVSIFFHISLFIIFYTCNCLHDVYSLVLCLITHFYSLTHFEPSSLHKYTCSFHQYLVTYMVVQILQLRELI